MCLKILNVQNLREILESAIRTTGQVVKPRTHSFNKLPLEIIKYYCLKYVFILIDLLEDWRR